MAYAERKHHFDYPVQAKNIVVGSNRRRGRPRLTAPALEYQAENILSDTEPECENPIPKTTKKKVTKRKRSPGSDSSNFDIFEYNSTQHTTKATNLKLHLLRLKPNQLGIIKLSINF